MQLTLGALHRERSLDIGLEPFELAILKPARMKFSRLDTRRQVSKGAADRRTIGSRLRLGFSITCP
jgi:hypothetical protein